jgi:ABC-2 type transport system permease protein
MIKIFNSFKFIWSFAKMQISSGMMYRLDFWGTCFYNIVMSIMQIMMFDAIAKYGGVAGWNKYQLYIFAGTFMVLNGVDYTLSAFGLSSIPDRVRTGTLDFAKTKPVSTLVFVTYGCPEVGTVFQIIIGLALVVACAVKIQVMSFVSILLYICGIALMYFLLYSIKLLIFSISFWTIKSSAAREMVGLINNFANKLPSVAIKGTWKIVLYIIFPVGLLTNVPCNAILGIGDVKIWIAGIAVTAILYVIAVTVWNKGLRIYDSASS